MYIAYEEFLNALISGVILLILTESVIFVVRRASMRRVYGHLRNAKREVEEIVQLSLKNPYPMIQLSDTGKILFANPAAIKAFPDILNLGIQHRILAGITQSLQNPDIVQNFSREINFGEFIYHQSVANILVGSHHTLIVYCYDVTQLAHTTRQLEESRKAAEAANEAKSDFLANMSHELRTPMNGIIGLSELLMESDLQADHKELIEAISGSSHNLLILLNDILDLSKIEAGELKLEKIPFSIRNLLKQIENLHRPVASRKGLLLEGKVDDNVPQWLIGDPVRIQQIINNLVSNAIKFTQKGSVVVHVKGEMRDDINYGLHIEVIDTGLGIPADKQNSVFNKFSQADVSTTRKYGGTGLGLSITKNLVEIMHGKISLYSKEFNGTKFHIMIPCALTKETGLVVTHNKIQFEDVKGRDARILIVDDHPANLLFMRTFLKKLGLSNFDEAKSGLQAVNLALNNAYDLIFMDCQMPEMDGFEATKAIREKTNPSQKAIIVALTADAMKGTGEKCVTAGMDDYISKPVHRIRLMEVLDRYLPFGKNVDIHADIAVIDSNKTYDCARLNEFCEGDNNLKDQIITAFLETSEQDIQKLNQGLIQNNHIVWNAAVHKLYGSASNIGAYALAAICEHGQSLNEDDQSRAEITQRIVACYQELQNFLERAQKNAEHHHDAQRFK